MKTIKLLIVIILSYLSNNLYSQTASDIFTATGITNGLCVRVGTTDGSLEMQLSNSGNMLVYGLALNTSDLSNAREIINSGGLNGVVSVDYCLSAITLPFANNLVNLLVVDRDALGEKAPSLTEIERVVAPFGAYYIKQSGSWSAHILPLKKGMAEWNHNYGDETNNNQINDSLVDVPTSVQWLADVEVSTASVAQTGFRFDNGKVFYFTRLKNIASGKDEFYYICRNAANGTLIWRKRNTELDPVRDRQVPVVFYNGLIYTFLSKSGNLLAIDSKTGNTVKTFTNGGKSSSTDYPNMVISKGKIFLTAEKKLFILDTSGTLLWSKAFTKYVSFPTFDAINNRIYIVSASGSYIVGREPSMKGVDSIHCFNTVSYTTVWQKKLNAPLSETTSNKTVLSQLFIAENKLFYSRGIGIFWPDTDYYIWGAKNLATGDSIWQKEINRSSSSVGQLLDATVLNGKLYSMSHGFVEFDANNGNYIRKIGAGNLRCVGSSATSKMLMIGFQAFADPLKSKITRRDITRSECGTLEYPSYGLLYYNGNRCQCAIGIRGSSALSSEPLRPDFPLNQRLTKYLTISDTTTPQWPRKNEWPMFMCNTERSSSNYSQIPTSSAPLLGWSQQVINPYYSKTASVYQDWVGNDKHVGPVTPPVISDSVLVVAIHEENKIVAYNAITGTPKWYYIVGGRLVSPPSLYNGLCIFGAGDGYVYCLKLKTGELIWKFFAAANQKKIVVHGHVETPWTLLGSLLIKDDKVIVNAGTTPDADGGIYMWALNPYSGKIIWNKIINRPRRWYDYSEDITDEYHYTASAIGGLYQGRIMNTLLYCDDEKFSFNGKRSYNLSDGEYTNNPIATNKNSIECNPIKRNLIIDFSGPGTPHNVIRANVKGFTSSIDPARMAYIEDSLMISINSSTGITCEDTKCLRWTTSVNNIKNANSLIFAGNNLVLAIENTRTNVFSTITGSVYIYDIFTGKLLSTLNLPSTVVTNGIAAAYGKLYFTCEDGRVYCYGSGTNEMPFARAGNDQLKYDIGLDGKEPFEIDASRSYAPYDSIVSYQWYEGPTLLASIAKKTIELTPGNHEVILKITSSKGKVSYDTINLILNANYAPGTYRYLKLHMHTGADWATQTNFNEIRFYSGGLYYPQCLKPKLSATSLSVEGWETHRSPLGIATYLSAGGTGDRIYDNNLTVYGRMRGDDLVIDLTNTYKIYPDSVYLNINPTVGLIEDSIYLYGSNDNINTISNIEWKKIAAFKNNVGNPTTGGIFWLVNHNIPNPTNAPSPLTASTKLDSVFLQWTDFNNNEVGFSVERKITGGHWVQIADLPANTTKFTDLEVFSGATYTYKICAYAGSNISPYSNTIDVTLGNFLVTPSNLSALDNNPIALQWKDNSSNENGFSIERKSGSSSFSSIGSVGANVTQFIDNTSQFDNTYIYRIRAINGSIVSAYSNELTISTPVSLPAQPSNLIAVSTTGLVEITLNWDDNSSNEDAFDIYYRAENDVDFIKTTTVPANYNSVVLNNISKQRFAENTVYYFYIVATNASGASLESNIDSAKTDINTPLSEVIMKGNYKIYPNPSSNAITIEIPQLKKEIEVNLLDMLGKIVYKSFQSSTFKINLSGLKSGEYLLRLYDTNSKRSNISIVVVH